MEIDKIYNCDCIDFMKSMPDNSIDFILTDPPFEFTPHGGGTSELAKRARDTRDRIDFIANGFDMDACFSEFLRICKIPNMMIFCSNLQIGRIMTWFENKGLTSTLLIWQKSNPAPLGNMNYISECEFIVYVHTKGSCFNADVPLEWKKKIYTSPICPDGKLHPTQKSVEHLRRYLLVHSKPNDIVFDPFIGSGTTAVACMKEHRHFVGCEIDKKYFDIANKRIDLEKRQLSLF